MINNPHAGMMVWFWVTSTKGIRALITGVIERDAPIVADQAYYPVAVEGHIPYLLTKQEMFETKEEAKG